jgi:hypothetical protein
MGQDRTIARQILTALVLFGLVSCSQGGDTVRGIVVSVDGGISEVTSFEVRADGETLRFGPAPDGDFDFPLVHLRDHLRTGDPVIVGYEVSEGRNLATSVADG